MKYDAYPQGTLTCSVCGKEFEAYDDTRYIIAGGYTCSWKCFLQEAKRRDVIRESKKRNRSEKDNKK